MSGASLPIRYKVTLLVCGLLLAGAAAGSSLTYLELRRAALSSAGDRLEEVTRQLTALLRNSATELKAQTTDLSAHPELTSFLRSPNGGTTDPAVAVLDSAARAGESSVAVEVWDSTGRRLLVSDTSLPTMDSGTSRALVRSVEAGDSAVVGPFRLVSDTVVYAATAPVRSRGQTLGFVVQRRRVTGTAESRRQLRELIGSGTALYVGNRSGDVWTDLVSRADPPPVDVPGSGNALMEYARTDGTWQLAAAEPVAGTPWLVLVEFPREPVIAGARSQATRLALFMTGLAVLGMLAAWALSRRLMKPLGELADAAEAVAGGDYSRHIDIDRGDEVGNLASAFNIMTEKVADARARLEQKVLERTAELQAVNEQLEAFSYSVSHDLRAPLRGIDGFCQALLEDAEDDLDETGKGHLRRVRAASQRMAQLIDDLLELSRVTRTDMVRRRVDLTELAREIVGELEHDSPRRVDVIIAPELEAKGDRRLLRVALQNLIGNAWKFTRHRSRPRIEVGTESHDGDTVFYVRDNGAGFDMAYVDKLFTPFHRLHAAAEFEGTGIGLATVARIVHRHGGRVWADAEVDGGATIRFTLERPDAEEVRDG